MKKIFLLILLSLSTFLFSEEFSLKSEIDRLVKGLGDKDYLVRKSSFEKLASIKIRAYPHLVKKLKEIDDLEVVEALERLVQDLTVYETKGLAGKEIPKNGTTWQDVNKKFYSWNSKYMIGIFTSQAPNGLSSEEYKSFLDLIAKKYSKVSSEADHKKLMDVAKAIQHKCNDAFVLMHLANNYEFLELDKGILQKFKEVTDSSSREYEPLVQFFIYNKYCQLFRQELANEDLTKITKKIIDNFIASISEKNYHDESERYYIFNLNTLFSTLNQKETFAFIEAFSKTPVDLKWIQHYTMGRIHLVHGDKVFEEIRKKYNAETYKKAQSHWKTANDEFLAAYDLRKSLPELCAVLISTDANTPEKARAWFDKTLELQVDIDFSYRNFARKALSFNKGDVFVFGNELLLAGPSSAFAFDYYPALIKDFYNRYQRNVVGNVDFLENEEVFQNLVYVFENSKTLKENRQMINLLIGLAYFQSDWDVLENLYNQLKGVIDLGQIRLKGYEEEIEYSIKGYLELKNNKEVMSALKDFRMEDYKKALPVLIQNYKNQNGYSKYFLFQLLLKADFTNDDNTNKGLYQYYNDIGYKEFAHQKIYELHQSKDSHLQKIGLKLLDLLSPFEKECYLNIREIANFDFAGKDKVFMAIEEAAQKQGGISDEEILQMKIFALKYATITNKEANIFKAEYYKLFVSTKEIGTLFNTVRFQNDLNVPFKRLNEWFPFESIFWKRSKRADRDFASHTKLINAVTALTPENFDTCVMNLLNHHDSNIGRLKLAKVLFEKGNTYWAARIETEALKWHFGMSRAGLRAPDPWASYQSMAQLLLISGYEKTAQYYADLYVTCATIVDSGCYLAAYISFKNGQYKKAISNLEQGFNKKKDAGTFRIGEKAIQGTKNLRNEIIDMLLASDAYNENTKKILTGYKLQ